MIDLTVKTLDSQNHKYSVPDEITVRQFKEKVASSVGIPADKQRLIYCGRVLQDDKKLSEYDVNGKVIHLVQRPPPPSATRPSTSASTTTSQSASGSAAAGAQGAPPGFSPRLGGAQEFLLGAFTIPSDVMDPNQVQQIVHQVVSGMGEFGRNATIMSRTSDDGSTVDVHINLGQVPLMGESRQRIANARNMIRRAYHCISRLEQRNGDSGSSRTSPTGEGTSAEEAATTATASSFIAEAEEVAVEGFADSVAVAEIIEGEIFIRPTIGMPSGGASGAFPVIADAARLAATTALAAATAPMTEIPPPAAASASTPAQTPENSRTASSARSADSSNGTVSQPQANGQHSQGNGQQQQRPQPTHAPVLATLMEELSTLQGRLQPYLLQYQTILREDRDFQGNAEEHARFQRTFNLVSEALHFISHAYHTVSDIMVDMAQAPPRTLRSRSIVVQQPTLMQAGIPLQAQINIGTLNAAAMHAAAAAAAAAATQAAGAAATAAMVASAAAAAEAVSGSATTRSSNSSEANAASDAAAADGNAAPNADSHQHTANIPLGIGIPAQMAGFFQSQNPVVFMEVGPGSITASVVSETVAGQPIQLSGNNGQSQARGNTATQPTTSTQTRSTSRPIQTIPIAFPGMAHPNFDPFLPCSSHHVVHGRRPVIPLRNLVQQQQGNAAATSPTDTQLAGIIANLMSALFSTPTSAAGNGGTASATGAAGTPSGSSAAAAGVTGPGRGGMQQLGRVRRMLGELLSLRRNVGDTSQTSTIADFLRTLPDYSYQEGEGLISDLVMTLARRLSLREFVEVLFGRSEILNRLCAPLQEFVRQRVLNDADPNDDNVHSAVSRLATSMIDVLRVSVQDIDIREGVNYFATLRNFLEEHLFSVIRIILSTRENDFGSTLYTACRQIIMEDVVLNVHCFRNGQRALERVVQNTVRQIAVDLDPFILQWMVGMCTVQIRAMMPNVTVREADILHYVIREATSAATSASSAQPTVLSAPTPLSAQFSSPASTSVPLLTAAASETTPIRSSMESSTSVDEIGFCDGLSSRTVQAPRTTEKKVKLPVVMTEIPSAPSEADMEEVVPSAVPMDTSEASLPPPAGAWQGAVPVDWVPIIAEDVQRQRRQSVPRPFSDAYVATMPSKRRKMMNGEKLQTVVEGGVLSDTLQRAISAVGAQPTTSLDAVLGDVAANPSLNNAFQEHLASSVNNRLSADEDYVPEKFPNADIVFRCHRPDGEP